VRVDRGESIRPHATYRERVRDSDPGAVGGAELIMPPMNVVSKTGGQSTMTMDQNADAAGEKAMATRSSGRPFDAGGASRSRPYDI